MPKRKPIEEEILSLFQRRASLKIKYGLERVRAALGSLRIGTCLPPAILIGGTNGKGSTAGILWRLLSDAGLRCGLYTSPHIMTFSERVQCSHKNINNKDLIETLRSIEQEIDPSLFKDLSFFEITTLIAFQTFAQERCDLMIVEVGLGGRLDATNVVNPIASCVTSVDFDHTEWLGSSLLEITQEKLGIARAGRPLFWGDPLHEPKQTLLSVRIEELLEPLGCLPKYVGADFGFWGKGACFVKDVDGTNVVYELPEWLNTRPAIIRSNFVLAVAIAHCVTKNNLKFENRPLLLEKFSDQSGPWPFSLLARFQKFEVRVPRGSCTLILDVCHNPAALTEYIRSLEHERIIVRGKKKIPVMFTVMRDKNLRKMIKLLREVFDPIMIFKADSDRSWSESDLDDCREGLEVYQDFASLWIERAPQLNGSVAVCGSFFAVGSVFEFFDVRPETLKAPSCSMGGASLQRTLCSAGS